MLRSRHSLLGLLVSLAAVLATGTKPPEAQTKLRVAAESGACNTPTAAANGQSVKAARINWTVRIAAGLLEGSFIRFAAELAKAFDDGDNLRILRSSPTGAVENIADLLYLRGVDLAITHADILAEAVRLQAVARFRILQRGNSIRFCTDVVRGDDAPLHGKTRTVGLCSRSACRSPA
jgi:TRAP-type uncharacterized transport system substrate-binding protein